MKHFKNLGSNSSPNHNSKNLPKSINNLSNKSNNDFLKNNSPKKNDNNNQKNLNKNRPMSDNSNSDNIPKNLNADELNKLQKGNLQHNIPTNSNLNNSSAFNKQPLNNNLNNTSSNKIPDKSGFDKYFDTNKIPKSLKNLGNNAKNKYGKFSNKAANGLIVGGKHFHIDLKRKLALKIIHGTVIGSCGLGLFGLFNQFDYNNPLFSQNVCNTQNDAGNLYSEIEEAISGSAGDWTQKGTQSYDIAKKIFMSAIKHGCSPAAAAGIVGQDGAIPSNYAETQFEVAGKESGGGTGNGLFQMSQGKIAASDIDGQVAQIINNWQASSTVAPRMELSDYKHLSDPDKAGRAFETYAERPGDIGMTTPTGIARGKGAVKAYQLFAKLAPSVSSDSSIADQNSSSAEQANDANCNGTPDVVGTSDSNIVNYAKKWLHKISYGANGNRGTGANAVANDSGSGTTDCSGFVWGVLKHLGYKVPSSVWTTDGMNERDNGQVLKEIPASQTQAGDIQVEPTGDAHTVILEEKYHGSSTKIIDEDGGSSASNVHESTFGWAYNNVSTSDQHFYRPIKK